MGISQIKAVFLDRDGVINDSVMKDGKSHWPRNLLEFKLLPGVVEGIAMLKAAGYFLVVVTNQPDVQRGLISRESVDLIHQKMTELLPLDEVRVCFDDGEEVNSEFRKPNPGMLLAAAEVNNIDLAQSYLIGDRWRDIDAGCRAGVTTFFIDHGYAESLQMKPHYVVSSLLEAAHLIVQLKK